MENSEIEDLIPPELIARELDRWQRSSEIQFVDEMRAGAPIVPQIESWAFRQKVELKVGWKVELAKRVKQKLLSEGPQSVSPDVLNRWMKLFNAFKAAREPAILDAASDAATA
jgi:hypothetical protein